MKALWNNQILAESDETIVIENNHYFPPGSLNNEYFRKNRHLTSCPWKGEAHYYDIVVNGKTNTSAAWYYPEPKEAAKIIKDYVAFWNGVKIIE